MPLRWTKREEDGFRRELRHLYVRENRPLKEIAVTLGVSGSTIFKRLKRLGIKTQPSLKERYRNRRTDVVLPKRHSELLAEFFGVMLGDGHISHFQTIVTLGNKERAYVMHVAKLFESVFSVKPRVSLRGTGYHDVYIGSTEITSWLSKEGLVRHKVRHQVDVPRWITKTRGYMSSFIRGFFDTDGSIYKIRHGVQISFTNYSAPLLCSLHAMLARLGYSPSAVSAHKVYLTRKSDVKRFFSEIRPENPKHQRRFDMLTSEINAPVG